MSISFNSVSALGSNPMCPICLDPLSPDQNPFAHEGENGQRHPFHRECIKKALLGDHRCPVCRAIFNVSPLLTTGEKIVNAIQNVVNAIQNGQAEYSRNCLMVQTWPHCP